MTRPLTNQGRQHAGRCHLLRLLDRGQHGADQHDDGHHQHVLRGGQGGQAQVQEQVPAVRVHQEVGQG